MATVTRKKLEELVEIVVNKDVHKFGLIIYQLLQPVSVCMKHASAKE